MGEKKEKEGGKVGGREEREREQRGLRGRTYSLCHVCKTKKKDN